MSAFVRAFLFCDKCGSSHDSSAVPAAENIAKARKAARGYGWHRTRAGRDICPDCWAEGHR
ncbi:hypothetical protein ABZ883_14580 [Streptomyces sp. NPDC046977]|uniref:hypothetical protein n=1 Tax=Streptomyces sp. NPDC046977 TaxID=3154703 RepID=UPI0033DE7E38